MPDASNLVHSEKQAVQDSAPQRRVDGVSFSLKQLVSFFGLLGTITALIAFWVIPKAVDESSRNIDAKFAVFESRILERFHAALAAHTAHPHAGAMARSETELLFKNTEKSIKELQSNLEQAERGIDSIETMFREYIRTDSIRTARIEAALDIKLEQPK